MTRLLGAGLLGGSSAAAAAVAPVPLIARAPRASDDVSRGYAVNDVWLGPGRRLWDCKRSTAGLALWAPRFADPPLAADVLPSVQAAYGTRRLRRAYTGPCLRVERASDTTQADVAFREDGAADWAALDAFLAGTTGRVVTWYDQSANARHATATGTARPRVTPFSFAGNARAVLFDSSASSNGSTTPAESLTIPAGLTALANSAAAVALVTFGSTYANTPVFQLSPTGANTKPIGLANRELTATLALSTATTSGSQRGLPSWKPPVHPVVIGASWGAGAPVIYAERARNAAGATTNGALAGGSIAALSDLASPASGHIAHAALIITGSAITDAQFKAAQEALYADFEVPPQRRGIVVADGDSITFGMGAQWFQGWPRQAASMLARDAEVFNVGINGARLVGLTTLPSWNDELYETVAPYNVLILSIGSNDIHDGVSATNLRAALVTYLASLRAVSPNWSVLLGTIVPRANHGATKDAERLAYNNMLRDYGSLGCQGVVDFAADPTIAASANPAAGTFDAAISVDGTHFTTLGYSIMAPIAVSAVDAWLASQGIAF